MNSEVAYFQVERNCDYSDADFASHLCTSVPPRTEQDDFGRFLVAGLGVSHFMGLGRSSQRSVMLAIVNLRDAAKAFEP
jgi:hypothetical protein